MKINGYKSIPFYGNTPDNTHCNQACMKMILGYYFPNEEFSMNELEDITGKKEGKWTWPMQGLLYLSEKGLDVMYFGTFDYERFVNDGEKYLLEKYGDEVGNAQIKNSDIKYEIETTKKMLHLIKKINIVPELDDIREFLLENKLVLVNVNYFPLYEKSGYAGHLVLVYGIDDKYIYLQDPGLPPNPNAAIPIANFERAWEYGGKENKSITTIALKS